MALNDPDSWQQLQADLRRIIPTIRRLRHTKTANVNQPASLLFDAIGADSLSAQQVSEGTLLVLGLLAGLYAPGRPSLMLLDDLDRGLHSKAQKDLISLLRGLLEASPGLQILASTHSPYMLDCMETKEVRMTVLRDDGATVCGPLSNHPQFEKWKDEMAPGEMWSLFGEKWLLEQGAPACKPRIAVVHEAPADYQTATELADRILLEAIDWLDEDLLAHQREWLAETPAGEPLTWRGIKHLARDRGIRATGTSVESRPCPMQPRPGVRSCSSSARCPIWPPSSSSAIRMTNRNERTAWSRPGQRTTAESRLSSAWPSWNESAGSSADLTPGAMTNRPALTWSDSGWGSTRGCEATS